MTLGESFEYFVKLGAVKYGRPLIETYGPGSYACRHMAVCNDLVYFFDSQDREIGYWSILTGVCKQDPIVFAPDSRTWCKSFFDKLEVRSIYVSP